MIAFFELSKMPYAFTVYKRACLSSFGTLDKETVISVFLLFFAFFFSTEHPRRYHRFNSTEWAYTITRVDNIVRFVQSKYNLIPVRVSFHCYLLGRTECFCYFRKGFSCFLMWWNSGQLCLYRSLGVL